MSARLGTQLLLALSLASLLAILIVQPRLSRTRVARGSAGVAREPAPSTSLYDLLACTGAELLAVLDHTGFVGKVFDSAGTPIAGVALYVEGELKAHTDAHGAYDIRLDELPALAPVESFGSSGTSLVAFAEGYIPVSQSASPGGGHYSFVLYAGGDLSGLVRRADRTAIAGAQVRVKMAAGRERSTIKLPPQETHTSEFGHFRLRGLPPFVIQVNVAKDGYAPLQFFSSFRRKWDLHLPEIVLQPAARATGRAVDASGSPIAGATARCDEAQALTDATGTFLLDGLSAGARTIELRDADHVAATVSALLEPGETSTCGVITMTKAGRLAGHVLMLPTGAPVPASLSVQPTQDDGDQAAVAARSTASGEFEIAGLAEGEYVVRALRDDLLNVASESVTVRAGATTDVALWLSDCALVTGRVMRQGELQPVQGARIRSAQASAAGESLHPGATRTTDEAGSFTLGLCRPGILMLEVDSTWSTKESRRLVLNEGDVSDHTIVLSMGVVLDGRLRTADGKAAKLRPTWVRDEDGWRGAFTDAAGHFHITGLSKRPSELVVRDPAGLDWIVGLESDAPVAEVELPARASLEITLVDANEQSLAESYIVTLRSAALREAPIFQVQGPSPLVIDGLPATTVTLLASAAGHRDPEPRALILTAGKNTVSLRRP